MRQFSKKKYGGIAILLHWLIALMIIGTFTLGLVMVDIPGLTPAKLKYFSWHKWSGVTILALACLRLLWRLTHAAPPYPSSMPRWQIGAAHLTHFLLYLLIFAVPLSGYFYTLSAGVPVVYFGIFPLPVVIGPHPEWKAALKLTHYVLNMTLLAFVCLHVLAALKHHFIDRDEVLKRMLP
ncbi:cytochrome b [Oxalobacteraceae bacterium CAVE-383]|nr:cytochrome b [Oxalobacteraceae bacterium CAVE-383]